MMDFDKKLEKAMEYNDQGKYEKSLKILEPLYTSDVSNSEVLFELVSTYEYLEEYKKARELLKLFVSSSPKSVEGWVRLSYIYSNEENLQEALEVVNSALLHVENNQELIYRKASLLSDMDKIEEMEQTIDDFITATPSSKKEALLMKTGIYESLASSPDDGEDVVKDMFGMPSSVNKLNIALENLNGALSFDESEFGLLLQRANLFKKLQEYDKAIEDYDKVLESMNEEKEPYRDFIKEQRDACLNDGKNERIACANMLKENIVDVENQKELSQEEHDTNLLTQAMAEQCENGDLMSFVDEMSDDPDDITAMTLAQNIIGQARTPSADFQKTDASEYEKSAQRFCDKAEKVFTDQGYTALGNYEPRGLIQQMGKRVFFRLFVANDNFTQGSAYMLKPLWPGFIAWVFMRLTGQWIVSKTVELESATHEGEFIITNNSGDINFFSHADNIDIQTVPQNASHREVFKLHQERLAQYHSKGSTLIAFNTMDDIVDMQERLRINNNEYRKRIGYVTDDELKKMLTKNYDKFASRIKKYIVKFTENG